MLTTYSFDRDEILAILPHRPPFLFVDRVTKMDPGKRIIAERYLAADEPHFAGHFPGKAIMPGALVMDALAQTSGLLWGFTKKVNGGGVAPQIFFLAAANIKFTNPAYPKETLVMEASAGKSFGSLFAYAVEASVGRRIIAKGDLTLAMVGERL